jgi:t-SNARE complex subunit (syntaxin)
MSLNDAKFSEIICFLLLLLLLLLVVVVVVLVVVVLCDKEMKMYACT